MLIKWHAELRDMVNLYSNKHIVDITNAAKWFYEDNDREMYNLDLDFPVLAPPWPVAYLDYKSPRYVYSSQNGRRPVSRFGQKTNCGCIFVGFPIVDDMREGALYSDPLLAMIENWGMGKWENQGDFEERKQSMASINDTIIPKWIIIMLSLLGNKHKFIRTGLYGAYLDDTGKPIRGASILLSYSELLPDSMLFAFAFGINMLHCSSQIELRDRLDHYRLAEGRGRYQEIIYKTLIVKPLEKQMKSIGENETSVRRALHFVRGNFAHYGPDNPLFGKLTGTFWRPAHVRGNKQYGEVKKDYKLQLDTEA